MNNYTTDLEQELINSMNDAIADELLAEFASKTGTVLQERVVRAAKNAARDNPFDVVTLYSIFELAIKNIPAEPSLATLQTQLGNLEEVSGKCLKS